MNPNFALGAYVRAGDIDQVRRLVELGATVTSHLLMDACRGGHHEVAQYLIEHGADPQHNDQIALHWAITSGSIPTVRVLLKAGIELSSYRRNAVFDAERNEQPEIVRFLMNQCHHTLSDDEARLLKEHGYTLAIEIQDSRSFSENLDDTLAVKPAPKAKPEGNGPKL
ncbi:ankyrin repeat domain-containing protein [Diaphorobacter aerolatus]|uniref:Ankyrin repeat domain-containing protein n=1 Tax=Diaphorobacter aerolatus TaxID=1288495 RepID=A0A7H0GJD7_9BURK|nr:ankyrin repeat domain-containing protein [Diaphorobacter aerolatus]QNP48403.1 ankyrin repeat domain-containing protein [Diaphorobacter aerolatus]